jgi:hypothetical protein
MRVKKDFQKVYKKHVKEGHPELTPEEQVNFEMEIRKLRYSDLCPDLPPALVCNRDRKPTRIQCDLCDNINFYSYKQLAEHNDKFHSGGSGGTLQLEIERIGEEN